MNRDAASIIDVERFARRALEFAQRAGTFEAFEQDDVIQSAVLHQLMVLGEATKRLSPSFRDKHSDIPWSLMARTRDRLIHKYDDVNLWTVWDTVTKNIPEVLPQLRALLPDE